MTACGHKHDILTLIRAGCKPESLKEFVHDKEIFRQVAMVSPASFKKELFLQASMLLRGDIDFMREILEIDPSLFICGTADVQKDLYMSLLVFAKSPTIVKEYVHYLRIGNKGISQSKNYNVIVNFADQRKFIAWLYKQLGVMFDTYDGPLRKIVEQTILNHGDDASDHFQNLILQYLLPWQVPSVGFLRRARQSYHNLAAMQDTIDSWEIQIAKCPGNARRTRRQR